MAADLDGTLLLSDSHELSPATIDPVRFLTEIGMGGDPDNDADTLAWSGVGVTMGDAPLEVGAMADHVCPSVD